MLVSATEYLEFFDCNNAHALRLDTFDLIIVSYDGTF